MQVVDRGDERGAVAAVPILRAAQLADPSSYADADLAARLGRDREALQQQLAKAEEAWSALYDEA